MALSLAAAAAPLAAATGALLPPRRAAPPAAAATAAAADDDNGGWRSLGTPRAQLCLDFTLPTGQSFRWRRTGEGEYTGVVGARLVELRQAPDDVHWRVIARGAGGASHPSPHQGEEGAGGDAAALAEYFNLGVDLEALYREWATADARFAKVHWGQWRGGGTAAGEASAQSGQKAPGSMAAFCRGESQMEAPAQGVCLSDQQASAPMCSRAHSFTAPPACPKGGAADPWSAPAAPGPPGVPIPVHLQVRPHPGCRGRLGVGSCCRATHCPQRWPLLHGKQAGQSASPACFAVGLDGWIPPPSCSALQPKQPHFQVRGWRCVKTRARRFPPLPKQQRSMPPRAGWRAWPPSAVRPVTADRPDPCRIHGMVERLCAAYGTPLHAAAAAPSAGAWAGAEAAAAGSRKRLLIEMEAGAAEAAAAVAAAAAQAEADAYVVVSQVGDSSSDSRGETDQCPGTPTGAAGPPRGGSPAPRRPRKRGSSAATHAPRRSASPSPPARGAAAAGSTGAAMGAGGSSSGGDGVYYAFPTLQQLAAATEDELRALGFGYRARFIVGAVEDLLARPGGGEAWLRGLRCLPAAEAAAALEELPGVGPKVAACVALFSLDKHDAIPVDTHVWQLATK
jgi:hypothetical protein